MRRVCRVWYWLTDAVLGGLPTIWMINLNFITFANDLACIEASISLIPSHPLFPFLLKRGAAGGCDRVAATGQLAFVSPQTFAEFC